MRKQKSRGLVVPDTDFPRSLCPPSRLGQSHALHSAGCLCTPWLSDRTLKTVSDSLNLESHWLFLLHVCLPWKDGSGALLTNHPMGLQRRQKQASMGCVEIHLWFELGEGSLRGRRPEGNSTDMHGKKKLTQ